MELFFFCCFFFLFSCFFKFFYKKLLALLILESLMLMLIFSFFKFYASLCVSFVATFFLSILMVLDSVFGICLLVSSGRGLGQINSSFAFV